MIPYIELQSFEILGVVIYAWGLFVALGFLFGILVSVWHAKKNGLDRKIIIDLGFWILLSSIIGGRIGHIPYAFDLYFDNPFSIFFLWDGGMSVFGGMIGAVIAGVIYLKIKKLNIWDYADSSVFGLPFGLWIGRIGCSLIHDHPGTATDFFLGIKYPDGIVRHDHGFYLSLNGFVLAVTFLILERFKAPKRLFIGVFAIEYGIIRLILDYYRVSDVTYRGLTPAQIFAIPMIVFGVWILIKIIKKYGEYSK